MSLAATLREQSDLVEADLQRFYGIDLAEYWRGELSLRRLSVLLHNLPAESATARHLSQTTTGWDVQAYLLADVYAALTGKPHPARPQPTTGKSSSRYADLRRALQAQRERLGA